LTKVVDFTKENWDIFGITDLRSTDFIEAGGSYFKPIASTAQILENPRLAEALLQKTEFTQQEWDEFGVDGLRMHHFVKSGNSYFRPGTEAQDVRVLRPLAHYGDFGEDGRLKWGVGDELVVGEAFTITFVRRSRSPGRKVAALGQPPPPLAPDLGRLAQGRTVALEERSTCRLGAASGAEVSGQALAAGSGQTLVPRLAPNPPQVHFAGGALLALSVVRVRPSARRLARLVAGARRLPRKISLP